MKRVAALVAAFACLSCDGSAPPPSPSVAPSFRAPNNAGGDAEVAARVGNLTITKSRIESIAAAQNVTPSEALNRAIFDALLAQEAMARGIDKNRSVELLRTSLIARAMVQDISARVAAQGPVTDAELDETTARHWIELDRPDAVRTVHAIVMMKSDASPDVRAKSLALANVIRRAVAPISEAARSTPPPTDPKATDPVVELFRKAANEVDKAGLETRVEALPPVVADGRVVGAAGQFDPGFSKAANELKQRGDVSPIVESPYGLHVIFLLQRIEGKTVPREERRALIRDEVMSLRARAEREKLLTGQSNSVGINRDIDEVLALVPVER
ncbi:MAG: peptidylprolyl isomerase [Polyangiaceae bacterium]|nr:peptidylprolyl isomerase [Polyangiaceae bacterium]